MSDTGKLQFGVVLPHNEIGTDPGAMRDYAQGAEALGATHLLIYDHVLGVDRNWDGFEGPYDSDTAFHEPMVTFGFLAGVTERIELITAILILPQRQTVLVAKQAAELAILSDNRFRLGVGVGVTSAEFRALNEEFGNRGKRQAEQVELLRQLWANDVFNYEGDYHAIEHSSILPRPSQPIPISFGGSAPAVLDRCARLGDGWIPLGSPNEKSERRIAELKRIRAEAGLPWDGFTIHAQAQYRCGDPERWQGHAQAWADLGATHLAVATHNAGDTDVDGHLARIAEYRDSVDDLVTTA